MVIKKSEIERILVIQLESISEVVLSVPVTRALKQQYPDARLSMLVTPLAAAVAEMNPYVDQALLYDKRGEHQGLPGMISIVSMLRKENFDLAVCMNFSVRGAVVAWAAGIRYRAGYDKNILKFFLTHAVMPDQTRVCHQAINHLQVLGALEITTEDSSVVLVLDEKTEKIVDTTILLNKARPNVAFCPINAEHPKRNPGHEKALSVIRELEAFADVYLIGGMAEKDALQALAGAAGLGAERILAGTLNLKEIAVFLKYMSVMVSVEAGPLYIAQALRVPVVALFGPTDPLVYGPCGNRDVVLTHKMPCMPCDAKSKCMQNNCIEGISLEEIVQKTKERTEN